MRKHFNETKNKQGMIITARYPILCPIALCDVFISWAVSAVSSMLSAATSRQQKESARRGRKPRLAAGITT